MSTFVEFFDTLSGVKGLDDVDFSVDRVFEVMKVSIPSFKKVFVSLLIDHVKSLKHTNEKDIERLRSIKSGVNLLYNNKHSQQPKSQQTDENNCNQSDLEMKANAKAVECKTKTQGKYQQQTFDIQSLKNEIFQHLDYESLLNCRKVNLQWMYSSYDPCSFYQYK